MKLYSFFRSSAAYRVRIALNLKGLAYEIVPVHFRKEGGQHRKPDFLEINPQGLLPVLEDGDFRVSQSLAIMEYLDELSADAPLLPSDPRARAIVRSMAQLIACDVHPLNNLRVLQYLKSSLGLEDGEADIWYRHWVEAGLAPLETLVERHGDGYCHGDAITQADVCLVPQLYNARRFRCDLSSCPTLCAIEKKLNGLDAFRRAAPERQPEAE